MEKYRDRIEFVLVYVREAHPSDGWQVEANEKQGVVYADPRTQEDRDSIALSCIGKLSLDMKTVVDDMKNTVDGLYCGWPERFYVIAKDGTVAYKAGLGPWGFKPQEVDEFLARHLADPKNCKTVTDNK